MLLLNAEACPRLLDHSPLALSMTRKQIARIHFFQGSWNEGIMEIEGIPSKYRTTGIQLLLAKFYERLSCNRAAKATYADAVRGQPLAVEAVLSLASLNSAVEYNDRYDELCMQYVASCISCDRGVVQSWFISARTHHSAWSGLSIY